MKICIFGKGSIGRRHQSIFKRLGCDVYFYRSKKLSNYKKKISNDIYRYKDLKKIKFDLICICNPTSLHLKTFKKFLY